MAKRIYQQEFDELMAAARAAYLKDIEAARGDSGKVSLAHKKLDWAEEAARQSFNQRSGLYKFFDSVPVIGKPLAIILDHIEKGIEEHGLFLGLVKGLLIGCIIAVTLIVVVEAVTVSFELVRYKISVRWLEAKKADVREEAQKDMADDYVNALIHLWPKPSPAQQPVTYYLMDDQGETYFVDNKNTPPELLDYLKQFHQKEFGDFTAGTSARLPAGEQVRSFFFHNKNKDVATLKLKEKGTFVIAALGGEPQDVKIIGGHIIFIFFDDYKAAELPMKEPNAQRASGNEGGKR